MLSSYVAVTIIALLSSSHALGSAATSPQELSQPLFSISEGNIQLDAIVRSGDATEKKYLIEGIPGGGCLFDYNHDGFLDIYIVNGSTFEEFAAASSKSRSTNYLFRNLGDGEFHDVSEEAKVADRGWGMRCAAADFNNDGYTDLYVTNFGANSLFMNLGDGMLDIFVANDSMSNSLFQNLGNNKFKEVGSYEQSDLLYQNRGDGTFLNISKRLAYPASAGRGAAFGDMNNDGKVDVVISNLDGKPFAFLNQERARGRHWLMLKLEGTHSNRSAIGARAWLIDDEEKRQLQEVSSGNSYISGNDLRLHFGLDNKTVVEKVLIQWPSGRLQTLENVPADRILMAKEPD